MKEITAYKYRSNSPSEITPGEPARDWMDFTSNKFAYGCLPLIIANEMGWDIIGQSSFKAIWNGDLTKDSILIQYADEAEPGNQQVASHFGHGVLTFIPEYLFQTEGSHNLYIKGIPKLIKDGIQALEGVVETDWLPFSFTMNWKFTRPNVWVEFLKGEPVARIMPYPRHYIEEFNPCIKWLDSNPQLEKEFKIWELDRNNHNERLATGAPHTMEKDYFKGIDKQKRKFEYHQKKINLKDFNEQDFTR